MTVELGHKPLVYTYPHFVSELARGVSPLDLDDLGKFGLWIAGGKFYQTSNGNLPDLEKDQPPAVAPWGKRWRVWQFDGLQRHARRSSRLRRHPATIESMERALLIRQRLAIYDLAKAY